MWQSMTDYGYVHSHLHPQRWVWMNTSVGAANRNCRRGLLWKLSIIFWSYSWQLLWERYIINWWKCTQSFIKIGNYKAFLIQMGNYRLLFNCCDLKWEYTQMGWHFRYLFICFYSIWHRCLIPSLLFKTFTAYRYRFMQMQKSILSLYA